MSGAYKQGGGSFTLSPGTWFALQILGPLSDTAASAPWKAATPIFITGVTPLKTGNGLVELEFIGVLSAVRPLPMKMTVRVVYRGPDILILIGEAWHGHKVTVAISDIDMEWLRRCCPRVVEQFEVPTYYRFGGDNNPPATEYLGAHFGTTAATITAEHRQIECSTVGAMSQHHAAVSFRRTYEGLDTWLLLRPVIPCDMDMRWLIFPVTRGAETVLRFHRSWTGLLVYEVPVRIDGAMLQSELARVNLNDRDRSFGTPQEEIAYLDWLIDNELLARRSAPPELPGCEDMPRAKRAWTDYLLGQGLPSLDWSTVGEPPHSLFVGAEPCAREPSGIPAGWTDYGVEDALIGPKLSSYPLHTQEWREAFLQRLVDVGEEVLLEAVSHAWSLLARPKTARASAIAAAAGVDGKGKKALWNVLKRFMDEFLTLDFLPKATVPPSVDLQRFHMAQMCAWTNEQERERAVVKHYAVILGGELTHVQPLAVRGQNERPLDCACRGTRSPRAPSARRLSRRPKLAAQCGATAACGTQTHLG